jgi:restriction endonuclease Mrr
LAAENQYLNMVIYWGIPLVLLAIVGMVLTARNRKREHERLLVVQDWLAMPPQKFEKFVAAVFEERGFKSRVVGASGDDGIDIELFKENKLRAVVQVKRYNPRHLVKPKEVRDFLGAVELRGAPGGIFVTSSDFTQAAAKYANHPRLKLMNGSQLAKAQADISRRKQQVG